MLHFVTSCASIKPKCPEQSSIETFITCAKNRIKYRRDKIKINKPGQEKTEENSVKTKLRKSMDPEMIFGVLCSAYRPISQRQSWMSVCHFEEEMTRDRSPRVQVVWVLVVFKLFRRPLLPARCSRGVFPVLGKIFKNFPSQIVVFVQRKLCSISKLLYRAVYDWLSFISNRKITTLHCTALCFPLFH